MKPTKIGIISLGCPRNLVDSQNFLGSLEAKGYSIGDINDAEVGVVNTCSFIDDAKKESIDAILDLIELKKSGRLKKIIVAGCLSQRYKEELLPHFKEVDAFIGKQGFADEVSSRYSLTPGHFAYLKIAEGCNHGCSFCVIPKIKGRLKSRTIESILTEARQLDKEGKSEINLIGQDVSHYGLDIYKKLELASLVRTISAVTKNIRWLRLLYLHPNHLTDDLIHTIAADEKVCKYVDLPLQHINNRILKAMNRQMDRKKILQLLTYLRKEIPGVALRTSLIVGFPGETQRQFKELISFIKEYRFERLGVFKYSREEGTEAFTYPGQSGEKIKQERFDALMQAQQEVSEELNKRYVGKVVEVLIDEKDAEGTWRGRLSIDAPEIDGAVYVRTDMPLKPGEFVKVRIMDTYEYDLVGELVKNEPA